MKKVLFTLAVLCGFACISFGAVSEATKAVVDKYRYSRNSVQAIEAKAAYDGVRADIKANGEYQDKLYCARVATIVYINEAPRSFAEANNYFIAQMKDLGATDAGITVYHAAQYFLFLKHYNNHYHQSKR